MKLVQLMTLVILLATAAVGCGGEQPLSGDGIQVGEEILPEDEALSEDTAESNALSDDGITWGNARNAETLPETIPTVSLVKTQVTRLGEVETLFHVEMDSRLHENLIVVLEYCYTDTRIEKEIVVMTPGQLTSEKFAFGKDLLRVKVLSYETILKLDPTMEPINTRVGRVDLTRYPIQERRYRINIQNGRVSR